MHDTNEDLRIIQAMFDAQYGVATESDPQAGILDVKPLLILDADAACPEEIAAIRGEGWLRLLSKPELVQLDPTTDWTQYFAEIMSGELCCGATSLHFRRIDGILRIQQIDRCHSGAALILRTSYPTRLANRHAQYEVCWSLSKTDSQFPSYQSTAYRFAGWCQS